MYIYGYISNYIYIHICIYSVKCVADINPSMIILLDKCSTAPHCDTDVYTDFKKL